jgi:hypothetical protein
MELSRHARHRMMQRGVTEEQVEAIIADPEYTFPSPSDPTVRNYVGDKYVVVVGKNDIVMTVHPRHDPSNPYRPLR